MLADTLAELKSAHIEADEIRPLVVPVARAAVLLGIAPSTLYELHHAGEITIRRFGRKSVVSKADIVAYIERSALPRGARPENGVGIRHPNKKPKAATAAAAVSEGA